MIIYILYFRVDVQHSFALKLVELSGSADLAQGTFILQHNLCRVKYTAYWYISGTLTSDNLEVKIFLFHTRQLADMIKDGLIPDGGYGTWGYFGILNISVSC